MAQKNIHVARAAARHRAIQEHVANTDKRKPAVKSAHANALGK